MLSSIEPFSTAEIAYRRQRIGAEFAQRNLPRRSRRRRGSGSLPGRAPNRGYRPAAAGS